MPATDEHARMLELQRKAFEAQFGSLESMGYEDKTKQVTVSEESENETAGSSDYSSEEQEYSFPSSGDEPEEKEETVVASKQPRVIKFSSTSVEDAYIPPSKKEQKLVRSGGTLAKLRNKASKSANDEENEDIEKDNLQNDIELQRFLKESHLLSAFSESVASGASQTLQGMQNSDTIAYHDDEVSGKARYKTLEMRLSNLSKINGRKNKLEKVPMHIRQGMVKKHKQRIEQYEQEARDAGVVLSRVKKGEFRRIEATYKKDIERRIGTSIKSADRQSQAKRQRGLRIATVGRPTRNGLVVAASDIARINGGPKKGKPRQRR